MISWPVELLELHTLHQEEERVSGGVVEAVPFGAHADSSAIESAQNAIHANFDSMHVEFLRHADGWNSFSGDIDFFATSDFLGSPRYKQAQEWIKLMDRRVLDAYAKQRSKLIPIGKSAGSTDLLLMINEGGQLQPKVLWIANELIEEFSNFDEMFVSFKIYARNAIDYWLKRSQNKTP